MKNKLQILWKSFKKVKPTKIIILIFLLVFNAFAWFIYATEVSTGVNATVKSWKIVFTDGENEIVNFVDIDVDYMYPGMNQFSKNITVYNQSDVSAQVNFEIMSARIFDTTYMTKEGYENEGQPAPSGAMTSAQLISKLANDYPFTISMTSSQTTLSEGGNTAYGVEVNWPFESGDDEEDTLYGELASDYHEVHPATPSILLKLRIKAVQVN